LKVARDLVGAYPDGVWLVELAPLSDPTLIAQAVAKALEVREQPGRPLLETLKDTLRAKEMLLVVDNCEHLVEAVVALVDHLLGSCPSLRVLATSRETLNASGEVNWVVPSLTVPDSRQEAYTPQELGAYESVTLFVERARQRDPSFLLTLRNGQSVAQICQRLDGIPLAIELAAGRIGVLSAEQLALRLDDYLKLLSRGERTAEPRHRSLRATLAWSHKLLSEPEQLLFSRLSVFAGEWTLEAAEEVCSGEGIGRDDVLDLLSELVERSLVVAEAGDEEVVRFRMLEPIRQYGQEFLEESGESEAVRSRHAVYYLALAEGADAQVSERQLSEARPVAWFRQMEAEHANLRAALSWSLDEYAEETDERQVELGLRLAVALFWFWHTHAHQIEGQRYLERAASGRSDRTTTRLRAQALHGAAWIALFQGDYEAAKPLMEESLALYREVGDNESIASGLTQLGMVAVTGQRDDIPLPEVLEELWDLKPRIKNRTTLAYLLILEGMISASRGDLEYSATLHEESLELSRQIRDPQAIFTCLADLGYIGLLKADYEGAVSRLREALRLGWERDYKVAILNSLYVLASVAASREQPLRAARLWGAVEGMEEAYGVHVTPMARSFINYEGCLAAARSQLDEETWLEAWAQGKSMPSEQAVEYALSEEGRHEPPTLVAVPEQQQLPPVYKPTERLTPREQEVALLVGRGLTNRKIALELSISEHTAATHVRRILKKLKLRSRTQISSP
jgi:predicted ATPase/DNA-binding CsgD family transcriptional regulator